MPDFGHGRNSAVCVGLSLKDEEVSIIIIVSRCQSMTDGRTVAPNFINIIIMIMGFATEIQVSYTGYYIVR